VRIVLSDDSALGEDPPHLRRLLTVVGNLLDNAIDAAVDGPPPEGGRQVRLTLAEDEGTMTVRVSDTGPGIRPGTAESIFEDGWSTRPDRGTARRGLGLALVHRLVQRAGGTIDVSEGPGAVFTVVLPLPDTRPAPRDALFTKALSVGGDS
jgi:two-component system CitB family sensor kinase